MKDFINYLLNPIVDELNGTKTDNNYVKQIRPFYEKLLDLDKATFIAYIFLKFQNKEISPEQVYRIIGDKLPSKAANSELNIKLMVEVAKVKTGATTYKKLDEIMVQLHISALNKEKFKDTNVFKALTSSLDKNGNQVTYTFNEPKENIAELMFKKELINGIQCIGGF